MSEDIVTKAFEKFESFLKRHQVKITIIGIPLALLGISQTLVEGVQVIDIVVGWYVALTRPAVVLIDLVFQAFNFTSPGRFPFDIALLTFSSFGALIFRKREIGLGFRVFVTAFAVTFAFWLSYLFQLGVSDASIVSMVFGSVFVYLLLGSLLVLSNQMLFADGETLAFKSEFPPLKAHYDAPQPELFATNLLKWPIVWTRYSPASRWDVGKRFAKATTFLALILALGLLLRTINNYADVSKTWAKRFGDATECAILSFSDSDTAKELLKDCEKVRAQNVRASD